MTNSKFYRVLSLVLAFVMTVSLFSNWSMPVYAETGIKTEPIDPVITTAFKDDEVKLYASVEDGALSTEVTGVAGKAIQLYNKVTDESTGEVFYQFRLAGLSTSNLGSVVDEYSFVAADEVVYQEVNSIVTETTPELEITEWTYQGSVWVTAKMPNDVTVEIEKITKPLAGTEHWLIWEKSVFFNISITDSEGNPYIPEGGIKVTFPYTTVYGELNEGDVFYPYSIYDANNAISITEGVYEDLVEVHFNAPGIVGITKRVEVEKGTADVAEVVACGTTLTFYDSVYADLVYSTDVNVTEDDVLTVLSKDTLKIGEKAVEVYWVAYDGENEAISYALDEFYGYVLCSDVEEYTEPTPTPEEVQEVYEYLFTIESWSDWENFISSLTDAMKEALLSLPEEQVAEIIRLDTYFAKLKQQEFAPPAVDFVEVAPLVFNATVGDTEILVDGLLPVNGVLEVSSINLKQMDKTGYDITDDSNLLAGYDIKITNNDIEWQPEEGKTIDVIINVSSMRLIDGTVIIVHHEHDGVVKKHTCTVENGKIVITVGGFSNFLMELEESLSYSYVPFKTPYQVVFKSSDSKLYGSHLLLSDYAEVKVDNTDIFVVEGKYVLPDREVYIVVWENGYLGSKETIKEYIEPTGNAKSYPFMLGSDIRPVYTGTDEDVKETYETLYTIKSWIEWETYVSELTEEVKTNILALDEEYVSRIESLDNGFYKEKMAAFTPPAVDYTQAAPLVGNAPAVAPAAYMAEIPAVMSARSAKPALMSLTAGTPAVASDIMPIDMSPNNGLELSKTTSTRNADGTYTITLEAFTTGTVTPGDATPSDIILVLDLSTSMTSSFSNTAAQYETVYEAELIKGMPYFRKTTYSYASVSWCTICNKWTDGCNGWFGHSAGNSFTPKKSSTDTANTQFYKLKDGTGSLTRLDALKTAMINFVREVADQGTTDNIAIVGFEDEGQRLTGSSNATAFMDATLNEASLLEIIGAISEDDLKPATEHGKGVALADDIFDAQTKDYSNRNKVVIMVTDGEPEPNGSGNWSARIVKQAIEESYELKHDHGATVYSISVMPGTDASNPSSNMDKYMTYVSSNYPNARYTVDATTSTSETTIIGQIVPGTKATTTGSYYLSAGNLAALNSIFGNIAAQTGGAKMELDATTQIKDIVSPYFQLPAGAVSDNITLTIMDATYTGGTLGWKASTYTGTQPIATVSGRNVTVSGFDFSQNFVAENGRAEGDVTQSGNFHGRKLVISFKVKENPDFLGGNNVPTNGIASGVYKADGTLVETFNVPTANVPVKTINPVLVDQHIYLTNSANLDKMISDTTNGNVDCRYEFELDNTIYDLNSINNAYVNIIYNIYDSENATTPIKSLTIPSGQKVGSWTNTELIADLPGDMTYYITCTVEPTTPGTGDYGVQISEKDAGTVYVYKPTVTVKDSTGWLGDNVPVLSDNYISNKTVWKHGDTLSTQVTMSGEEPIITNTYTPGTGVENGIIVTTSDIPVNVKSMANGKDITQYTTYKHQNCSGKTCTLTGDAELLIHVNTVALNVSKKVTGSTNTSGEFSVTVEFAGKNFSEALKILKDNEDATLSVNGGKATLTLNLVHDRTVKLTGLPIGKYTVTEDDYSARYNTTVTGGTTVSDRSAYTELASNNVEATIAFVNELKAGYLTIKKVIEMPKGFVASTTDEFTIVVKQGDTQFASVTLKNGETCSPIELVAGTYTVVETVKGALYDDHASQNHTVTIEAGEITKTTVTNPAKTGSLEVGKTIVNKAVNYDATKDTFAVKVKVDGYTGTELDYTIGGETKSAPVTTDGYVTITLAHDQSAVFKDLLANVNYDVIEILSTDQKTVYKTPVITNGTSAIIAGDTQEATITNTVKTGTLVIDKNISLPKGVSVTDGETFAFTVTGPNGYSKPVTVTKDGEHTLSNLLVGEYNVVENLTAGQAKIYTTSYSPEGGKATVQDGESTTVTVTNTVTAGNLEIIKTVEDKAENISSEKKFTVEITFAGDIVINSLEGTVAGNEETVPVTNGKATVLLAHGQTASFTNIPVGVTYTVTETGVDTNYYSVSYDNKTGTISVDTPLVTVTNTRNYGKLTITKVVKDDNGNIISANPGETFLFTVTGENGFEMQVVIAPDAAKPGYDSVTLNNLPIGDYAVTEDTSWSYKYATDEPSVIATITTTMDGQATITNVPKTDKWLKADAYAENVFAEVASTNPTVN